MPQGVPLSHRPRGSRHLLVMNPDPRTASNGIISIRASPGKMATSSHSKAACATNASTRRSSKAWPMPAESWPSGATTTTTSGRIPRSATRPRQKRAGRLSKLGAPRPTRLPNPKPTNINPKDSRYERGTTGGQVKVDEGSCQKIVIGRDLPTSCDECHRCPRTR